jgi:SAM-dependent methyltransferase
MAEREISAQDLRFYTMIRENVSNFIRTCAERYDRPGRLLDIAPQAHEGAAPYFRQATISTLDKNPQSAADYHLDICADNTQAIPPGSFDLVVCTEVLEHTLNPFAAVGEVHRMLKPGGLFMISTPFNFRIHGPLPDCWRFTEHGLRALLDRFTVLELNALECSDRWLMPIHYTAVAEKICSSG